MPFDFKSWKVSHITCECGSKETLQLIGTNEHWYMNWCTQCGSLLMTEIHAQKVTVWKPGKEPVTKDVKP